jgi:hypothetical protein
VPKGGGVGVGDQGIVDHTRHAVYRRVGLRMIGDGAESAVGADHSGCRYL